MVSGRSIFQELAPAAPAPDEPLLELSPPVLLVPELLERSALDEVPEEVLERSALELVPAPEVLDLSALELLPMPLLEEELPMPDDELASLRGEELLEPIPVLEPVPVLLPDAPAPPELDSRMSETVVSGAPCEAGKVTIATPNPFSILLEDAPLRPPEVDDDPLKPPEVDDDPLRPPEVDELPLRPLPELLERSVPDDEVELRSVPVDEDEDDPIPLLLLRSVDDDDDEPIPPLLEDEPERPPLEVPELVSERRPLLLLLPLLDLPDDEPEEFTGQLESSAGLETSPCTMVRSLKESDIAV